LILEV